MPRQFVIGDIHGFYHHLMALFETVSFDYRKDLLISLGDVVDHGPQPAAVIEELRKIRNFIHVMGNHDEWCYQYLKFGHAPEDWITQGGQVTIDAYKEKPELTTTHLHFFENSRLYYIDAKSRLFVHAGFDYKISFEKQMQDKKILQWTRTMVGDACNYHRRGLIFPQFREIFIGHTPTQFMGETLPVHVSNVWMLDTGITLGGKLTMMNIATKEYWQSGNAASVEKTDTPTAIT
ncbi:MAG: metallophosphoesterase [Bacteroidota bacterium]